jgi:hypothetical protein
MSAHFVSYTPKRNTNFEHLCFIGERLCESVAFMSEEAIRAELTVLGESIENRIKELVPEWLVSHSPSSHLYMTDREISRMHDLKMTLPSSGEEAERARARIKARIESRRLHRTH